MPLFTTLHVADSLLSTIILLVVNHSSFYTRTVYIEASDWVKKGELQTLYLRLCKQRLLNHGNSIGDDQEKQACSYKLAFAENTKFVKSKFEAHFF
jgi:hypothetical protein